MVEGAIGGAFGPNSATAGVGFKADSFADFSSGLLAPVCEIFNAKLILDIEVSTATVDNGCPAETTGVLVVGTCFSVFEGFATDIFNRLPDKLSDGYISGGLKGAFPIKGGVVLVGLRWLSWEGPCKARVGTPEARVGVFKGRDTIFGGRGHWGASSRFLSNTLVVGGKTDGLP